VDVDGDIQEGTMNWAFKNRRLVLFHYIIRSRADWRAKLRRRGGWQRKARPLCVGLSWLICAGKELRHMPSLACLGHTTASLHLFALKDNNPACETFNPNPKRNRYAQGYGGRDR
jgi:hypothetical protein